MSYTKKTLPKNELELSFEFTVEELQKDLEHAAEHITENRPLPGYRPGKAPFDVVKKMLGEMALYEHALPEIVRREYVKAVIAEKLAVFGEPKVNVTKMAPGNALSFTCTVTLVPNVTSLADYTKVRVARKEIKIDDKEVDKTLKELQKMQTREVLHEGAATNKDKIVVDVDMSIDNVAVEGGTAKGHGVYLNEEYFIPGFKEQVIGMKAGDTKKFVLDFPADHFQKNLAGKPVQFNVSVKQVFNLVPPELNDEFAASVGKPTMTELRELIKKNMLDEAKDKEDQRVELELLEKIVEKSTFEDIPEAIINAEIGRMIEELKNHVVSRGGTFEDYLLSIKKSESDLRLEFAPEAVKRIKTALVLRDVGEKEKIVISDADVLEEVQKLMAMYTDPEIQKEVRSEEYQDHLRVRLQNRAVLKLLNDIASK